MGNQRVGIFPPKSKILFVLSLALIWCPNFLDRTIPVGGDTWTSFWRKDRRRRIKKYPRSGLFFQSNISETVGDIRVLFPLWARAIVALPNGANNVSVIHIVSEIWRRQHQNFGMLTYPSERNQYPFEWIRTANKEISAFWAVFPVKYLRNGRRYSSSVSSVGKGNSRATKRCKRRFCHSYRLWDMTSSTSELRNADLYERAKSIPVRMNSHG